MKIPKDVVPFIQFGWTTALTLLVFIYGGYRLDVHFKKSPVFVLAGVVLGLLSVLIQFLSAIKKSGQK